MAARGWSSGKTGKRPVAKGSGKSGNRNNFTVRPPTVSRGEERRGGSRTGKTFRGLAPCAVCGFEGRGFGFQLDANYTLSKHEFCSMLCQKIGGEIAKLHDGDIPRMPGKLNTDVEKQAIMDARIQLAEVLEKLGIMPAFENLEPSQIDDLVTAVVIGFQASVHRQCSTGKVPF